MKAESKKAVIIGIVCIATYLANYYLRNILSVLTPQLLETNLFTVEHIGLLSSIYMFFYAAGQLANGFLGDLISPKKMVVAGVLVASTASILFPFLGIKVLQILCFSVFGMALSMVRGPMMKIISENTEPNHARTICVFFSFASFSGPLIASLFAMINQWDFAFVVSGLVAIIVGIAAYTVLTIMEKKEQIHYRSSKGEGISSVISVFKIEKFAFYMFIASLVEISGASISFWIPTFLNSNLLFSKNMSNIIFTIISLLRSFMPFVTLAIFRATNEKDITIMRVTFFISAILFAGLLFAPNKWFSLIFLLLALMSMSCSSALLWSIYIPGLGKTGKVSSVNGILDSTGYVAAAMSNILFSQMMIRVGWNGVFILWSALGVAGVTATILVNKSLFLREVHS